MVSAPSPLPAPVVVPRKSPAIAWFFSVVIPGAGQIYCGKVLRGVLTFVCIAVAGGLTLWFIDEDGAELLLDIALRTGLLLYAFAGLDAYFTAREINSGYDSLIHKQPRVAAILNLTTRGFGYFYLAEHEKGVLCFFILGIAGRMVRKLPDNAIGAIASIGFEVALVVLAVDAYRIAMKKQRIVLAAVPSSATALLEADLGPILPIGFAGLVILAYVGILILGLMS